MINVETERTLCAFAIVWFFGSLFLGAVFAAVISAVRARVMTRRGIYRYR